MGDVIEGRDVVNPVLFESAWEVANKVGGIYTVIKTKAAVTSEEFGDRYFLMGPLNHKSASAEVEFLAVPNPHLKASLEELGRRGVYAKFGRWLIPGAPYVILFDVNSLHNRLLEWKSDFHHQTGIDPLNDSEVNDAILFGYAVSWFLGEYISRDTDSAVIAHFHEWQTGVALMLCRKRNLDLATVFTTHATLLGRYLCAGSEDFYNRLKYYNVDAESGKRGIYHRYCIERGATGNAHVFTTVSHITAYEANYLLFRKADGVTPNGLNVYKFSAMHEFQNLHARNKEKIHQFVKGHFYGNYDFNLDETLYFFTAGRYEYRNKGVDMFLEGLARLNYRLKAAKSTTTVVAFIILPAKCNSFAVETLKGQAVVKQLEDTIKDIQQRIGQRLFEAAARGGNTAEASRMDDEEKILLKRRVLALKPAGLPPIVTHNLADDANDPVLCEVRRLGLYNKPEDRVKVVFHPEFLNSSNPVLGMDYEDFVRGCHLGVFPSYYEPWGYTPAECTVMGVPSITTNLSGFGCFMQEVVPKPEKHGIYIVDRRMKSIEESCNQLADQMFSFCSKTRRERITQRNRTERLSDILDWKRMGKEYQRARHFALRRQWPQLFESVPKEQAPLAYHQEGGTGAAAAGPSGKGKSQLADYDESSRQGTPDIVAPELEEEDDEAVLGDASLPPLSSRQKAMQGAQFNELPPVRQQASAATPEGLGEVSKQFDKFAIGQQRSQQQQQQQQGPASRDAKK